MVRVVVVVGTRPEAIRLAPVVVALDDAHDLTPRVVATGQHPEMTTEALDTFGVAPDVVLDVPATRTGGQGDLMGHLLPRLDAAVAEADAGAVVVQGDTAGALGGALAGFWQRVPVAHVEAGLRTATIDEPFPEEAYRRLVTRVAARHLAPTPGAAANLLAEGVDPATVVVTGNTVVDAARLCAERNPQTTPPGLGDRRIALLTVHRRESGGEPLARILRAARALVDATPDLRLVVPVHPDPLVHDAVHAALGDHPRVVLSEPLPYPGLIWLLSQAAIVLTDSGGIQEEAPTFGTPVVVLRDTTERPEAVEAGTAWLVGTDPAAIVDRSLALLGADPDSMAPANPFGDGHAARRVVGSLRELVHGAARPADWVPAAGAWAPPVPVAPTAVADLWAPHAPAPEAPLRLEPVVVDGLAPLTTVAAPSRTERLRRELVDAVPDGLRLGPPTPTRRTRDDSAVGEVVEHRRGTQVIRHVPDLVPSWPEPGGDLRTWRIGLDEGEVWLETAGWPITLDLADAGTVTVRGGAASARWDIARGIVRVTVVTGRVDIEPREGPGRALGPRQVVEVPVGGGLGHEGRIGPDRMDADAWIGANRRLSQAHPASRQPTVDTLTLLADL